MSELKFLHISEFGEIVTGSTPLTNNNLFWNGDYNFYSPADFTDSVYCFKTEKSLSKLGLKQGREIPKDSILVTCIASIGKIAINGKSGITNQQINTIVTNERFDFKYIYYLLVHNSFKIKGIAAQTTIPIINKTDFGKIQILAQINKSLQQKIAHILTTCDTVIEQTQSAISKYKAIKQGLLHDLFTRGLDTNGKLRPTYNDAPDLYKDSELGMIPKEWEVKRLEECTTYVDYRGKTPPKSDRGIVLVTAKNIRFGFIDYELSKEYIYEYAFESAMSRGKAFIGDVLITTEAPMGNVAQIDKEGIALAQRVIKYQGHSNELNNDFLKLALMSDGFQKTLLSEATGSTALGIKGSRLHKLKILIPKIEEQKETAQRIKVIDNKIQTEENLLQKYQSIKQGLMGDLLGGNIRRDAMHGVSNDCVPDCGDAMHGVSTR